MSDANPKPPTDTPAGVPPSGKPHRKLRIGVIIGGVLLAGLFCYCGFVLVFFKDPYLGEIPVPRAVMDIKNIEKFVMVYEIRNGVYPPDLQTLVLPQQDGRSTLLTKEALIDPWNNPYVYESTNLHPLTGVPHIYSTGPPGFKRIFDNWQTK